MSASSSGLRSGDNGRGLPDAPPPAVPLGRFVRRARLEPETCPADAPLRGQAPLGVRCDPVSGVPELRGRDSEPKQSLSSSSEEMSSAGMAAAADVAAAAAAALLSGERNKTERRTWK